jgi:hypothetical protein
VLSTAISLRADCVIARIERRQARRRLLRRSLEWGWVLAVLNVGFVAGLRYALGTP